MDMTAKAADIVFIEQLISRGSAAVDGLLPAEAVEDCFTPDARLEVVLSDGSVVDAVEGHAALADFCRRISAKDNTRRWAMNHIVDVDGDTATARCHGAVILIEHPSRAILRTSVGIYALVRTPAGWRVKRQSLTLDPGVVLS